MVPISHASVIECAAEMTAPVSIFLTPPCQKEQIQALFTLFNILQSLMLISKALSNATKRSSRSQIYKIYSFTTLRSTNG